MSGMCLGICMCAKSGAILVMAAAATSTQNATRAGFPKLRCTNLLQQADKARPAQRQRRHQQRQPVACRLSVFRYTATAAPAAAASVVQAAVGSPRPRPLPPNTVQLPDPIVSAAVGWCSKLNDSVRDFKPMFSPSDVEESTRHSVGLPRPPLTLGHF